MGARWITHKGRRRRLSQWARDAGLAPSTLRTRLDNGVPLEAALESRPMTATQKGRRGARRSPWRGVVRRIEE